MRISRGTLFIGGKWVPASGERLELVSPVTEETLSVVTAASRGDVDLAVSAAREAFDSGPWPRMAVEERAAVVRTLRDLLSTAQERLARLITDEMGCPIGQSRSIQAANPVRIIDAYLGIAASYPFRTVRQSDTGSALITREPVGVAAAVVPWNVPLGIAVQKLVPAVLAGCSVIIKPAPQTTLDAYLLAEFVAKAGFPEGVVNVVAAEREVSEYLVGHPGVDKVSFTGSTGAGRRIASLCGQSMKRVTLELGGKSAAIVLDDADLEHTVESLRMGAFRNSGQVCTLKTRVLVPEGRRDELITRLEQLITTMPVGDPHQDSTQIGPLVTAGQRDRVQGYIQSGIDEGARLVAGGPSVELPDTGWFVAPTVFDGVTPEMSIAREEIFGPVLAVLTYSSQDQAVRIANDSDYGLNGAVFTTDADRGLQVAAQLRTGVVEINGNPIGLSAPFGGFKLSGVGRENGPEGLDSYTEPRSIGLPRDLASSLR